MRLNKKTWKKVLFGDYVDHIETTETDPVVRKKLKYVSVEHIDTGELKIKSWSDEVMPTFFRKFKAGQILFGKRRAYQRKVAIAHFDGICSPHIWALEARKSLEQSYLPYVMLTEKFYEYVNANSAGTMSPYVKWPQLSKYSFLLPSLKEQSQIVALFQSIETAVEQVDGQEKNVKALWKKLVNDFVNDLPSFGNMLKEKNLKTYNFCDVTEKLMRKIDPLTYNIGRIVGGENLESEDFRIRTWQKVGEGYLGPAFHVLFKAGDILYGSRRTYLRKVSYADFDGVCANTTYVIRAKEKFLLQVLLKHIMLSEKFTQYSIGVSKGSTNPYINWKDLDNFSFQIPDLETQKEIANVLDGIVEIIERLKQQKNTLSKLKQKLLNEILG
jgi:type I restriction enzyme S subunit